MSNFDKRLTEYRVGNWRESFKHINASNVEKSIRSILSKQEKPVTVDKHGVVNGRANYYAPISTDEAVFRLLVLFDTQMRDKL
jgi:hypothetical protein